MLWWQEKRRDFLEPNKRKDVGMSFFFKGGKTRKCKEDRTKKKGSATKEECMDCCKKLQNPDTSGGKKWFGVLRQFT